MHHLPFVQIKFHLPFLYPDLQCIVWQPPSLSTLPPIFMPYANFLIRLPAFSYLETCTLTDAVNGRISSIFTVNIYTSADPCMTTGHRPPISKTHHLDYSALNDMWILDPIYQLSVDPMVLTLLDQRINNLLWNQFTIWTTCYFRVCSLCHLKEMLKKDAPLQWRVVLARLFTLTIPL